jgi:hypothetical protein
MTYKVTNLRDESVTFQFDMIPHFLFTVKKDDEQIWREPGWALMGSSQFTLLPGETREFPDFVDFPPPMTWDMRNKQGELVNSGTYDIFGMLTSFNYENSEISIPVNIIPEPATIMLLSFGLLPIFRQKRRSSIIRHI